MTIDSSWIASFKEEAPEAITKLPPFQPKAVFCDGQIRLMRGNSQGLLTWDDYIWQQFQAHIAKFYRNHGVSTVILAFDDYAHVPEAKCMTQLKRRRHIPKLEILAREPLPPVCPCGARWEQSIANRVFKAKVIARVIEVLPGLLNLRQGQSLIIDYAGAPIEHTPSADGTLISRKLEHLCPLGEADIKFPRYAEIYRDLLVDSVDGDSIPIALVHTETAFRDLTMGTMRTEDLTSSPPRISIYRITTRVDTDEEPSQSTGKRKKPADSASTGASTTPHPSQPKRAKRTFEYVSIPALFSALRTVVAQCLGRAGCPSHNQHYISMLVSLIGLTGTDFSRQLPQVSGKTLFNLLPDLIASLLISYDPSEGQLNIYQATDRLVAGIYAVKFRTHVTNRPSQSSLKTILATLRASKLSERTRSFLPTNEQILCTVRNVNWILRYWRNPTLTPTPTELNPDGIATYGFVRRNGLVGYADL